MSALICAAFLPFGFTFGDLKLPGNELPRPLFEVFQNNVLNERSGNVSFKFKELIPNLMKFLEDSNMRAYKETNSTERKCERGKSKGTNEIVIPLFLLLKITGKLLLTSAVVKLLLLTGFFSAKVALIILGVIFAKKLRRLGTLVLLKNHEFYFGNGPGQYPTNEPNLSGYGYEYNFVPGFQTPEQKYSSLLGEGESQKHATVSNK